MDYHRADDTPRLGDVSFCSRNGNVYWFGSVLPAKSLHHSSVAAFVMCVTER